jgi:predicted transcriptional regulator
VTPETTSCPARSASTEASSFLRKAGFETIRTTGTTVFDLVAWKEGRVIFLVTRRSRSTGMTRWIGLVSRLAGLAQRRTVPGEIQFWVCRAGTWYRYRILPGGSVPAEWEP